MKTLLKITPIALLLLIPMADHAATPAPWQQPLYLAGGGYWPERVAVEIKNDSAVAAAGEPVEVSVPALAGVPIASLRACAANGKELLWDIKSSGGGSKDTGRLKATDRIILPVECPANGVTTEYLYAGNEQALPVPELFRPGLVNGSFEAGTDGPEGWTRGETDAQHTVSWDKAGGRNGSGGAETQVEAGAPATWVQWRQGGIPVVAGRTYRLSGWVRSENVTGSAGFYVHVSGEGEPTLLVNQTLSAGEGSYDWKQVTATFTAPPSASTAEVGTLLHGTGRAWFDDVELTATSGAPILKATPDPMERLAEVLYPSRKAVFTAAWPYRASVRVFNLAPAGAESSAGTGGLAYVDLRSLRTRLPGTPSGGVLRVVDPSTGLPVTPCFRFGDGALFAASVPASAVKQYDLYFGPTSEGANAFAANYSKIIESGYNLAPNGSFEKGTDLPEGWTASGEAGSRKYTALRSTEAKFGLHSLETMVPADAPDDWVGWRSGEIPVEPGTTLLYGGWVKSRGLSGPAALYAHLHAAGGKMVSSSPYLNTAPEVHGDSDWTFTSTQIQTPGDMASIQLHLTTNEKGTLFYDGILLCRVLQAEVTKLESARSEGSAAGLQAWESNPLVKVFPDDLPGPPLQSIQAELARNESHAVEFVLRSSAARKLHVSVSPLVRAEADNASLPPVEIEQVGYVPIDHPSGYFSSDVPGYYRQVPTGAGSTDGWAGEWPDPLLPRPDVNLQPGRAQALWLTVQAPADAAPGHYSARVSITGGLKPVTLPLDVTVLPFALPDRPHLKVIFDLRSGPNNDIFAGKDRETELRKWYRIMADHRMSANLIDPPPVFTYTAGKVSMDATVFDRMAHYVLDELKINGAYTPDFFYSFGWAYPPARVFGLEPFTPEYNRAYQDAIRLFSQHLKEKGWYDRFTYYISDEPHFDVPQVVDQMKKLCDLVHEADPTFHIYSSTWRYCPAWDNSLDVWGVGQYGSFPLADMKRLQAAGKQFWFTVDGQIVIDTPYLATERLLPYYCFKYGLTGFEYWGLSWWTNNPWQRGWHTFIRQSDEGKKYYWTRYPNGDGYLTYPGAPAGLDGPASSIRLEQVREGLQDYEALRMLTEQVEAAGKAGRSTASAEKALALACAIVTIPNAGGNRSTDLLPNPDLVPAARRAVNRALVELMR